MILNIADLLKKFSSIEDPKQKKVRIAEIVEKISGVIVDPSFIEIKKDSLVLNISQIEKNEVFFKKKEILAECEKESLAFKNII